MYDPRVHYNHLWSIEHSIPAWIVLVVVVTAKLLFWNALFEYLAFKDEAKGWLCFYASFLVDQTPNLRYSEALAMEAMPAGYVREHKKDRDYFRRMRLAILYVLCTYVMFAICTATSWTSWYETLLVWLVFGFFKTLIDMAHTGVYWTTALQWATRITVATSLHTTFGSTSYYVLRVYDLAPDGFVFWMVVPSIVIARHIVRREVAWLMTPGVFPITMRRYLGVVVDLPICVGFYVQPRFETLWTCCLVQVVVDVLAYRSSRKHRSVFAGDDFIWIHLLAWITAAPAELRHTIGIVGTGQRLLVAMWFQTLFLLLIGADNRVYGGKEAVYEIQHEVNYSMSDVARWIAHTTAVVLLVVGTSFSIRASL